MDAACCFGLQPREADLVAFYEQAQLLDVALGQRRQLSLVVNDVAPVSYTHLPARCNSGRAPGAFGPLSVHGLRGGLAPSRLHDELLVCERRNDPGGGRDRFGGGYGRGGLPRLADDVAVDGEGDHFERCV